VQFISTEHLAVGKPKAFLIFCRDSGYTNEHGLSELRNGAEMPRGFFAILHKLCGPVVKVGLDFFTPLSATAIIVLKSLEPHWYKAVIMPFLLISIRVRSLKTCGAFSLEPLKCATI